MKNLLLVAAIAGVTIPNVQAQTIKENCDQLMREIEQQYGYAPTCRASPVTEQTGEVLIDFGGNIPYIIHITPDPLGKGFYYSREEIYNLLTLLKRPGLGLSKYRDKRLD